jgi:phage terminase large subunit GpA-like protein
MEDIFEKQLIDLINNSKAYIPNIKPSVWTEQNVFMGKPFPGPYRYSLTPYWREVIDRFAADNPMRWMAIMKGAQVGYSSGVLIPLLLWMIQNDPSNAYFLVGSPDLVEKATEKLDIGIDNAGLRNYIKPQTQRKRNNKTGDTNTKKEFVGGYIHIGSANNHKAIRDVSLKYGIFDDFESVKSKSKESGDTRKLLEQRFAAYKDTHKIAYGSTPELKKGSNIEPAFLLGDQRKYLIPCPCCGQHIELKWTVQIDEKERGGIFWQLDNAGKVIPSSVGYVCQMCAGFFTDRGKSKWLLERGYGGDAYWHPTAEPSQLGYYSYHISSLYAPAGMFDWNHYVHDYVEANPIGQPRNEHLHKTLVNVCWGETYEEVAADNKASQIQSNTRNYNIGTVPESLSIKDGNGKIVILTLSADLNGKVEDGRVDYEVCAWSETGASYSIVQGSIGTFVPRENTIKFKQDREPWSYQLGVERSVWRELNKIIDTVYLTDSGRKMKIAITGVDTSFTFNGHAYEGVDTLNGIVVKLKGKDVNTYSKIGKDMKTFQVGKERPNLFLVEVNYLKDLLSERMNLMWDEGNDSQQPSGFMNYPIPSEGKYLYKNYFEHFEAEHRITKTDTDGNYVGMRWEKKTSVSQNHFYDVHVYAMALKDIIVFLTQRHAKITGQFDWAMFVDMILPK